MSSQNATLNDGSNTIGTGFHGLVYIDPATSGVRRITLEVDTLPRKFSMNAAAMTVDYDYVTIGEHDYLLPVRAPASIQRRHREIELNEMVFRDYRRHAARPKINFIQQGYTVPPLGFAS